MAEVDGRMVFAPPGETEWLVKLPGTNFPGLVANELTMMQWAEAAGFDVPEVSQKSIDQIEVNGVRATEALVIRRYDRTPNGRVHQEDFCQVRHQRPEHKYDYVSYDAIARVSYALMGEAGLEEFVRRLLFVLASGNTDAHLKNWSLLYPNRVRAEWSPLYDQVCTVAYPEITPELSLKLAGARRISSIDVSHFERLCEGLVTPVVVRRWLSEATERLVEGWRATTTPMLPEHIERLQEHWRASPLFRQVDGLD